MKNITFTFLLFLLPFSMLFAQTTHVVVMTENEFSPATLNIEQGDIVTWVNSGAFPHTSTSGADCTMDNKWNSGDVLPGDSFTHVFSTGGNFPYFCVPHCAMDMTGSITVSTTSSINKNSQASLKIQASPNPATSFIEIEITGVPNFFSNSRVNYTLFDITGRTHRNIVNNSTGSNMERFKIDIDNLPQGTYILQVNINDKVTQVTRVVKN